MSEFAGMLFTLKKREQHIEKDDTKLYKYMIMGYYDGLDIHTVEKWYDFRPRGLQERGLQVDLQEPFIDQYTFRALVPENRDDLEERGFNYNFWLQMGYSSVAVYENFEKEIRQKNPFVCMSVMNLTGEFVKDQESMKGMQDWLANKLLECAEMNESEFRELHCAIFPSIGYSDFIVVFLTDSLDKVANVICRLRGVSDGSGNAVISNCYSVCGLDRLFFDGKGVALGGNIRVTIRINLKQGISPQEFLKCMTEELSVANSLFTENLRDFFYVTFGNADCFLLPGQSIDQYLRLYCNGGILNPGNSFFQKYISDIRTSIWLSGLEESAERAENKKRDKIDLKKFTTLFQEFIEEYDRFLKENNGHMRNSRALQQMMKNFLNIVYASHGFDVAAIVGDAILCILCNVREYINVGEYYIHEGAEDESEEANKRLYITQCNAVKALNEFREYIGLFISDLIRSDRPFIEGSVLTHSSIGSATKLLFAYNAMLRKLTERYGKQEEFVFVVLSGGCDRTTAVDFFEDVRSNMKKPVVIQIPEMSLYDIQGTLFRILHEYMHFIGSRKRKERYKYLIRAIAGFLSWEICEYEYNGGKDEGEKFNGERWKKISRKALDHLPEKLRIEIEPEMENIWRKSRRETETRIFKAIWDLPEFREYGEANADKPFFAQELKNGILGRKSMTDIFGRMFTENAGGSTENIQKKMCDILYEADKDVIEKIYQFLKDKSQEWRGKDEEKQLELPIRAFWFARQKYKSFNDDNCFSYDFKIREFLKDYFDSFFETDDDLRWHTKKFSARFGCTRLVEHILSAMIETFSDCAAVYTIGMKVEDFLLAFIYELWDIDSAFPTNLGNVLRLGADFQILYGISETFPPKAMEAVMNKVALREKQGYKYQNVSAMLERVNEILREYQFLELAGIRGEVEAYLRECFALKEEWQSKNLMHLYELSDMDTEEKIYGAVNELICLWKNLEPGRV